jgi:hypothetical protein
VPTLVAADLPARLTDQEFWKLVTDLSEPNGSFRSDNLLSNEVWFQRSLPQLARMTRPGGAYIGVGPEQNFTYVVALKPAIAFIVDVRRGNLDLQLMYKALFELSTDRADFVSRLFSRRRPATLTAASTPTQIFNAISAVSPTEDRSRREPGQHQKPADDDAPVRPVGRRPGRHRIRLPCVLYDGPEIRHAVRHLWRDDPADLRRVDDGDG